MSKLKLKISVSLLQLLCLVVSGVSLHGEFERFSAFCVNAKPTKSLKFAAEMTIHNNWSRFTFILSFNLAIPRYKFTILRLFNILPHISLHFEQTTSLAACVGSLCRNEITTSPRLLLLIRDNVTRWSTPNCFNLARFRPYVTQQQFDKEIKFNYFFV